MIILHLSDLHFGAEDPPLVEKLASVVAEISPDLIIASGDFTQRGSRREFKAAREFFARLQKPWIAVPGNHDVPRLNPLLRVFNPFHLYRSYISPKLDFTWENDVVKIVCLNTARSFFLKDWNWASGSVNARQLDFLKENAANREGKLLIAVVHHPAQVPDDYHFQSRFWNKDRFIDTLLNHKYDLMLCGHSHISYQSDYRLGGYDNSLVCLSAPTAISVRRREGHGNGFNVIKLDEAGLHYRKFIWNNGNFASGELIEVKSGYKPANTQG